MGQIVQIHAREILDSQGKPTIEVDVITTNGIVGRASVPSGNSTGKYSTHELRDNDKGRFLGNGVLKAVNNVNKILNDELNGFYITDQSNIDAAMIEIDGTEDKSNIGSNAILGVSLAVAKAAAKSVGQPLFRYIGGVNANTLPIPMMNLINGGSNANNKLDFNEFMIMPISTDSFVESVRIGAEVFQNLKLILRNKKYSTNVAYDGSFAPEIKSNEEAIELILQAVEKAGYMPGKDVILALNIAASDLYDSKQNLYHLQSLRKKITSDEMIDYLLNLVDKYQIISIEDGLAQDDWKAWNKLNSKIGGKIQLVGNELFETNVNRLLKGINDNSCNSILVRLNRIGTLTEAVNCINLAKENSFTTIISHSSGETEDTTISELAVALNTGLIKTGSVSRTDRVSKYNQLIRIEENLGVSARYLGNDFKFI